MCNIIILTPESLMSYTSLTNVPLNCGLRGWVWGAEAAPHRPHTVSLASSWPWVETESQTGEWRPVLCSNPPLFNSDVLQDVLRSLELSWGVCELSFQKPHQILSWHIGLVYTPGGCDLFRRWTVKRADVLIVCYYRSKQKESGFLFFI